MTTPATGLGGELIAPEGTNVIGCSCKESFRGNAHCHGEARRYGGATGGRSRSCDARPDALHLVRLGAIHRSALGFVLLVPQGVVEIEHALTEGAAAGVDTNIGTGQTRLRPTGLIGATASHPEGTVRTGSSGRSRPARA